MAEKNPAHALGGTFHRYPDTVSTDQEVAVTLIALLAGLWVRRSTWRKRWETAGTINLACIAVGLALMAPATKPLFGFYHDVTGIWNVEDLTGHLLYLAGISVLAYATISRLDIPDIRHLLGLRIKLPVAVTVPTLIGVFVAGAPDHHAADLMLEPVSRWLSAYWVLLCCIAAWILGNLLWALLIVRTDGQSAAVADLYIAAVTINLCALIARTVGAIVPTWPDELTWALTNVACIGYVAAAIRGMVSVWPRSAPTREPTAAQPQSGCVADMEPEPPRQPRRRHRLSKDLSRARHRPPL